MNKFNKNNKIHKTHNKRSCLALSLYSPFYLFLDFTEEAIAEIDNVPTQNVSVSFEEQSTVGTDQTEVMANEDTNREEIQKLLILTELNI